MPAAQQHEDGRSRRARQRRAHTRSVLVEAARGLFGREGYHATTPERIAAVAGVARATFYTHFETKADAFAAVLDELLAKLDVAVQGVSLEDDAPAPALQLAANLHRVLDVLLDHPEVVRLLLVEASLREPCVDERVEAFFGRVLDMIRASLVEGRAAGLVREGVDPDLGALCVLGSIREVLLRGFTGSAAVSLEHRAAVAAHILAFNLLGVATPALRGE